MPASDPTLPSGATAGDDVEFGRTSGAGRASAARRDWVNPAIGRLGARPVSANDTLITIELTVSIEGTRGESAMPATMMLVNRPPAAESASRMP